MRNNIRVYPLTSSLVADIGTMIKRLRTNNQAMIEIGGIVQRYIGPPSPVPVIAQVTSLAINELDRLHDEVITAVQKYSTH